MNWFKILSIISLISSWLKKSMEDGRITLEESLDLIELLAGALSLPLDFDVAGVMGGPEKEAAIAPDEGAAPDVPETAKITDSEDEPSSTDEAAFKR